MGELRARLLSIMSVGQNRQPLVTPPLQEIMAAQIVTVSMSKAEQEAWQEIFKSLDVDPYSPTKGFRGVLQLLGNTIFDNPRKYPKVYKAMLTLGDR